MGLHKQHNQIGVGSTCPCGGDHGTVEVPAGSEQAGGINEYDLRVVFNRDATNAGPRGLDFMRDDGHLRANHFVQQG